MYIQHCSTTTLCITQESCGPRASWWGRQALNISQPLVDDCSHDCIYASQGAKGKGSQSEDRWMKGFEWWIMHTGSWYKVNISYLLLYGTKSKTLNCEKLWQERKINCVRVWGFELKRKKKEVESQDESEYRPTHWFPPRVNQHKIWWCLNYS